MQCTYPRRRLINFELTKLLARRRLILHHLHIIMRSIIEAANTAFVDVITEGERSNRKVHIKRAGLLFYRRPQHSATAAFFCLTKKKKVYRKSHSFSTLDLPR